MCLCVLFVEWRRVGNARMWECSCADVLGSASGHGGISAAEMCRMSLADLASNIVGSFSLVSGVSYTPPSGYTYVADLCAATCGGYGVGATACGGSGSITPFSEVATSDVATLRARRVEVLPVPRMQSLPRPRRG